MSAHNENKKLNTTVFFNMLGPVILNGIGFFTMPIFTRMLGPANYGLYTIYNSYQSILLIFMSLQTQAIIAPTSIYHQGESRDKFFSNALSISLVSSLIISLIAICFIKPLSRLIEISPIMIVVMLIHTVGMLSVNWMSTKLSYDKQAKWNFTLSTGLSLLALALSLLMIFYAPEGSAKYKAYVFGHAIPYTIIGAVCAGLLLKKGRSYFDSGKWKFCLALCGPIVFHALSNTVLHQCDKIMIQKLIDDSAAGVYGFAVLFANVMAIIFNALNVTWVPFYHDDVLAERMDLLKKKTNNYTWLFSCLTIGFIMAMPEVVKLFAKRDFWAAIDIIPILTLGIFFTFLYTFPVNFEFYHKRTKNIAVGTMLAAVFNIAMNFIFIRRFGMFGAAFATLLSYVLLYLFHLFMSRVIIKEEYHYPFKFFYAYTAVVVGMTVLFYFIKDLIWLRWSIFALSGFLLVYKVVRNKSIF